MGWILSSEGSLTTGVFEAISAGTFLYIATVEVIVVKLKYIVKKTIGRI